MDKLEWKKRTWAGISLLIVSGSCIITILLGVLFLSDEAVGILAGILLGADFVYMIIAVTVQIISYRDEDQYEEIRKAFNAELCKRDEEIRKRDDRLYQRQKGIRSMVSRYKCLKNNYSILESRCAQLEVQNRELSDICAKLRGENLMLVNASYLRNHQISEKENPV